MHGKKIGRCLVSNLNILSPRGPASHEEKFKEKWPPRGSGFRPGGERKEVESWQFWRQPLILLVHTVVASRVVVSVVLPF